METLSPLRSLPPLLLLLLLCSIAPPAWAVWPHDPNVNLPVKAGPGAQEDPAIVSDGSGGAILAWTDGVDARIHAQRIDAAGTARWGANGVLVCATGMLMYDPVCLADGAGGVILAWFERRNGLDYDVYAQRLDSDGVLQWAPDGVAVCAASGNQQNPMIVSNGEGGAIVAWSDGRSGTHLEIRAQELSATGTLPWRGEADICSVSAAQSWPRMVADGSGGAIFSWLDARVADHDVYAQRVDGTGLIAWASEGVPVCATSAYQDEPALVADGAGGAIVAWTDARGADWDVYAQRLNVNGAPQWTANGVPLCAATGNQMSPALAADGAGGAIVAWDDGRVTFQDIYAQRVNSGGAPQWTSNGVVVTAGPQQQLDPVAIPDGWGGAIVAWTDSRAAMGTDVYAQRLTWGGSRAWDADGMPVSTAVYDQQFPLIIADGAGGTILTWWDMRGVYDIYAQRIDGDGRLGPLAPRIDRVRDVPADQGGAVQVLWYGSALDVGPGYGIASYTVWRRLDTSAAAAALTRGAGRARADGPARPGDLRVEGEGAEATFWEYIASVPARAVEGYAFTVATAADSTGASVPWNTFFVDAKEVEGSAFHVSAPDSGYSVDNLAPPTPSPFTGSYADGVASLSWGANPAADFTAFRLYRGTSPAFAPGPANLVVSQPETAYEDVAGGPFFYKLCAVDVHGNESPYSFLQPSGTADVPGALPRGLALSAPSPNPARGGCTMRLALPREARVSLAVHDPLGRRVRTLLAGTRPAGEHVIRWDGRDAAGRPVPDGLYLVRLECEGRTITRRLVTIE